MTKLLKPAFEFLPLGAVKPAGWLERQLRIQADGLTGHLDEFWPDVSDSAWFGGKADSWERAPYWLDGAIPLAFLLDDPRLIAKVKGRVESILSLQGKDGWLGARENYPGGKVDLWSHLLVDKALLQYFDATGDPRVLEAVERHLRMLLSHLDREPLFNWGKYRWFEGLVSVFYVYERTGAAWLLDLARKLHAQGFDYAAFYRGSLVTIPTPRRGMWTWDKHVVNTGMMLKAYPLWYRMSRSREDRDCIDRMLAVLDQYHGQANGMFTGDENLAGIVPVQGTELCAVAECMYSLEHALAALGNPAHADRLERIAFNAWPATNSPDMWSHQYDQQANQVQCTVNPEFMWTSNEAESNLFGLEPNFGCCTANLHQAWPKFAASLWMKTADGGLAAAAYAPSRARTECRGVPVSVALDTDYPFRDTLRFTVTAERPVAFPLVVRVPAWAAGASLSGGVSARSLKPGTFHRIERTWKGTTPFTLRLPMRVAVTRRYHDAVAIERGPLVYSLKIGEEWKRIHEDKPGRELPHADWEVRPTTPWNYALEIDERRPERSVSFEEKPVGACPFSPDGAPVTAKVKGRKIGWGLKHGWADEAPRSPVESAEPEEELTLIPYGCGRLRITEFPVLAARPASAKKRGRRATARRRG